MSIKKILVPITWEFSPQRLTCMLCNEAEAANLVSMDNGIFGFNLQLCPECSELGWDEVIEKIREHAKEVNQ